MQLISVKPQIRKLLNPILEPILKQMLPIELFTRIAPLTLHVLQSNDGETFFE